MVRDFATALVLGGGGLTGIAWETGLLFGLEQRGIHLRSAELLVGTSAGSVVAAQIASPVTLKQLYQNQLDAIVTEVPGKLGVLDMARLALAMLSKNQQRALASIGARALRSTTVDESVRRAVIMQRLPLHEWPSVALRIAAIEATTGAFTVFDKASRVSLVDAVGASCAVPMVWPCVTIDDKRYFDGGIRSSANVDLAEGAKTVVVLAPLTRSLRRASSPAEQLAALGVSGLVVSPDAAAAAAMGRNSLDPTMRASAAAAGFAQAERVADSVAQTWT